MAIDPGFQYAVDASVFWLPNFTSVIQPFCHNDCVSVQLPEISSARKNIFFESQYAILFCAAALDVLPTGFFYSYLLTNVTKEGIDFQMYVNANKKAFPAPGLLTRDTFLHLFFNYAHSTVLLPFDDLQVRLKEYPLDAFLDHMMCLKKVTIRDYKNIVEYPDDTLRFLKLEAVQQRFRKIRKEITIVVYAELSESHSYVLILHKNAMGHIAIVNLKKTNLLNSVCQISPKSNEGLHPLIYNPAFEMAMYVYVEYKQYENLVLEFLADKFDVPTGDEDPTIIDPLNKLRDLTLKAHERIDEVERAIPRTQLLDRTIIDVIDQTSAKTLGNFESTIGLLRSNLSATIRIVNESLYRLQDSIFVQQNAVSSLITDLDLKIQDNVKKIQTVPTSTLSVNELTVVQNEMTAFGERLKIVELQSTKGQENTQDVFKSLSALLDKMFATGRITRRQGYFNLPSIGAFSGPVLMITNEGILKSYQLSTSLALRINPPRTILENYSFRVSTTFLNDMKVAYFIPNNKNYEQYKGNDSYFETPLGMIVYASVKKEKHFIQDHVLYITQGRFVYL